MRTKERRIQAKKLLKKPPGRFEQIDLSLNTSNVPQGMTRAFINNRYVVMIFDNAEIDGLAVIKAMVQRHDDKPIPNHWNEMQNIKNQLFGREVTAIEYYPAESNLVDEANIYWLWIFPPGVLPIYMKLCK